MDVHTCFITTYIHKVSRMREKQPSVCDCLRMQMGPVVPTHVMELYKIPIECIAVSYTHLRAHETKANLVCRLLLEKKKRNG